MKTVVVAGGAGFIGSHLCEGMLAAGNQVICVDSLRADTWENIAHLEGHNRFRLLEHDASAPVPIEEPVDGIYNLACMATDERELAAHHVMGNVVITHSLLSLAKQHGAAFVQVSTGDVYAGSGMKPLSEETWTAHGSASPTPAFDQGRRAPESICEDFQRRGVERIRVARVFDTYGPRMRRDDGHIISGFISRALAGKPLPVFENGRRHRTLCHVADVVRGLTGLMQSTREPEGPVNFGGTTPLTELDLAGLVAQLMGVAAVVSHQPLPREQRHCRVPDITRAETLLGWRPTVPLTDGLRQTIDWFSAALTGERDAEMVNAGAEIRLPDSIRL